MDNFAIEFIAFMSAASSRTLSLSLQKIKAEFNATERMGVAKFGDLNIGDHRATSNFKCIQFMAALNRQKPKEMTPEFVGIDEKARMQKFDVEIRLGKESYEAKKFYLNNSTQMIETTICCCYWFLDTIYKMKQPSRVILFSSFNILPACCFWRVIACFNGSDELFQLFGFNCSDKISLLYKICCFSHKWNFTSKFYVLKK